MRYPEVRNADTVEIRHPASGATAVVTRSAFERRSRHLGWQLAHDPAAEAAAPVNQHDINAHLDEKAQLRTELEAAGVEVDGRWGLKRLRAAVEAVEAVREVTE